MNAPEASTGSGCVIRGGRILTNAHVDTYELGADVLKLVPCIILGTRSERWERSRPCCQQASDARLSLAFGKRPLLDEVDEACPVTVDLDAA